MSETFLFQDWQNRQCTRCPLANCRSQIVVATHSKNNGLLAIGEAPGAEEDTKGEGFVGKSGQTLDRLLAAQGFARQDYGRANICRCRPPDNRRPTKAEIAACLPFLADLILASRPKVLLLVGGTATEPFLGAGALWPHIEQSQKSCFNDFSQAHPLLRQALTPLLTVIGGIYCIPMPHTSPLAFNRNAPSGEKWSIVAERQIAKAINFLR